MALLDEKGLSYLWNKIKASLNGKSDVGHKHSYNDLDNKPTIPTVPTSLSQLTNDEGFLTQTEIEALIESIVLNGYLGGKRIRYVDDANDSGIEGYLTVKKG